MFPAGNKTHIIFLTAPPSATSSGSASGVVNLTLSMLLLHLNQFLQQRHLTHHAYSTLHVVMASVNFKKVVINVVVILDTLEVNAGKVGLWEIMGVNSKSQFPQM